MLALKVPLKDAEKIRLYLKKNKYFNNKYKSVRDEHFAYFPMKSGIKIRKEGNAEYQIVNKNFEEFEGKDLRKVLKSSLTDKEFKLLKTAYDIVGDIAILEIPRELIKKQKIIAEALLKIKKNIRTVLKKSEFHTGVFRTQKLAYLAGINTKEALHKENNVKLKIDVEKVYFSVRLAGERKRIAQLVKPGERVLVFFSGCAPYPIVISKNSRAKEIFGIEINPVAHKYAVENLGLNHISNVKLFLGDVKKIVPKLAKQNEKFDRILMPLPKSAEDFLDDALIVSKKDTIIHFYDFLHETKFNQAVQKIDEACKKNKKEYELLDIVKCGQHSPWVYRICVDFKII